MAHPPKKLQAILWSADVSHLDLEKDKWYVVHQLLIYGTLTEIKWLFHTYGVKEVVRVFVTQPARLYSKKVFHFIKNYVLPLRDTKLYEEDYVTSIYGPIRQRTQGRV
ncbi:hypothetical protein HY086_03065 [Candidatus Gottesmanbacteria bacterium]|nr:hypothetical protein [Candidatus Gottesmanbacteria bacterium]